MIGTGMRRRRGRRALSVLAVLALSACNPFAAGPERTGGTEAPAVVTIYGSERKTELVQLSEALARVPGIRVEVTGDDQFEDEIERRVREGRPPDIALFPQPAGLHRYGPQLVPLDEEVPQLRENFDAATWLRLATVSDQLKAVPVKSDLKSVVWYSPPVFARLNYEVPTDWDAFLRLIDTAVGAGHHPLCVGLESGAASGWPFTDWVEDVILRRQGAAYFDRWVSHAVPFDDPPAVAAAREVAQLWARPGVVLSGAPGAATRKVYEAGQPVLDGRCLMYRQANFMAAYWPSGMTLGPDGGVNAFYVPGGAMPDEPRPTLTGGNFAAAFNSRPATMAVMRYLASTESANERARYSGVLSPNRNVDTSLYPTKLEQTFAKDLKGGCPIRFDASDLMPPEVGSDAFWQAGLDIVGGKDVATAFQEVERAWPAGTRSAPAPTAPRSCARP